MWLTKNIAAIASHTALPLATETAPTSSSCASAWLLWVSRGCTAAPRLTWAASGNSSRASLPAPLATSPLRSSQTDLRQMAALLLQWKASFEDKLKGKSLRDELHCCHRKWMLDYRHGSSGSRGSWEDRKQQNALKPKASLLQNPHQANKKVTPVPLQKKKKNKSAPTNTPLLYMSFGGQKHSFILAIYLMMIFLTCICSSLIDTVNLPERLYQFKPLPVMYESSCCSIVG